MVIMSKLSNTVTSIGNYKNIPTLLTSNTISFNVRKVHNDFFILKSRCELRYNDDKLYSNYVTVVSPIRKNSKTNYSCDVPYWRY